jgi:hypothetical protein
MAELTWTPLKYTTVGLHSDWSTSTMSTFIRLNRMDGCPVIVRVQDIRQINPKGTESTPASGTVLSLGESADPDNWYEIEVVELFDTVADKLGA